MATQTRLDPGIFDKIGDTFTAFTEGAVSMLARLFGSANERQVLSVGYKRPKGATEHTIVPGSILEKVNSLEEPMQALSDEELKGLSTKFKARLAAGETLDDLLPEAFAACREAGRRTKGMRHYDTQIVGGVILHRGNIAEMVTGEGKTLVATLPAYLNALEGKGVHVVTVNDYLARRDCEWMVPIYNALGVSAAYIQSDQDPDAKRHAYDCDITYGTSSEFGFDYLRDNMKLARHDDTNFHAYYRQVQRTPLNFAIIDEVDNILIDEARTPLIISGPSFSDAKRFAEADKIARQLTEMERKARHELAAGGSVVISGREGDNLPLLQPPDPSKVDPQKPPPKGVYFEIKEKERSCHLTDAGAREAERLAGVESFYTAGNMEWPHLMDNALKAHHLYSRDKHYMIAADPRENNQLGIIIIDEFTGRAMFGRQWSDGLHQAVEAKHLREGVQIKQETQTLATVTLQNFFKLFKKLAGMTGTAMTEANEFWKIYKLDVVAIPTNKPLLRINHPDLVYRTDTEKWNAVLGEVEEVHKTGRPILIGTTDVAKSEVLSAQLKRRGIKHELLNAKPENVAREAEIVAQAGRMNAVTISTNMAGRGTDIILGGNAETLAWARLKQLKNEDGRPLYPTRLEVPNDVWHNLISEIETKEKMKEEGRKVAAAGGLHIVGTERHESRRIDNQLRGRAGRQGDPGSGRFYLSLNDDLMRMFAGEWVSSVLTRLGMQEGEAIESRMVTRRIEKAQKKVEEFHFDQRKNLLEYDEVMDFQRKKVYGARQELLDGKNPRVLIIEMIREQTTAAVAKFLDTDYGAASFATFAADRLGVEFEANEFRGASFDDATKVAYDKAQQTVPTHITELIEENFPPDEEQRDWKWNEMSRALSARYGIKTSEKELKKIPPEEMAEHFVREAIEQVHSIDLSDGKRFLEPTYPAESLADWMRQKFSVVVKLDDITNTPQDALADVLVGHIRAAYRAKDIEFPVKVGMQNFMSEKPQQGGGQRFDREGLFNWAVRRLGPVLAAQKNGITALTDEAGFFNSAIQAIAEEGLTEEVFRTEPRSRLRELLMALSPKVMPSVGYDEIEAKVSEVLSGATAADADDAKELAEWARSSLSLTLDEAKLVGVSENEALHTVLNAYDEKFRPEMHSMERSLIIEQLDSAWKAHLLAMDHIRSGVGLRSYGQEDPKIVYKREGMKEFDAMWEGVRDRTTESVFRMEDLGEEEAQSALWAGARATHAAAASAAQARSAESDAQNQSTSTGGEGKKIEPIRNVGAKVGRNDPCPCGSGKKYKNCHMKLEAKR